MALKEAPKGHTLVRPWKGFHAWPQQSCASWGLLGAMFGQKPQAKGHSGPGSGGDHESQHVWTTCGNGRTCASVSANVLRPEANVFFWNVFSHGCNCDTKVALRSVGMFQFWVLMFCSWNFPYGFESDEQRRLQSRECMSKLFSSDTAQTSVLYRQYVYAILREWKASRKEIPGIKCPEEELWEVLQQRVPFSRPAYRKASMCRFLDAISAAEANLGQWHIDLWGRATLALDQDFLKGSGLMKRITVRSAEDEEMGERSASTSSKVLRIEDRALRGASHNSVALSVMLLCEDANRRIAGCFLGFAAPLKQWHSHQNKVLRSGENSMTWLTEQIADSAFMKHVCAVLLQLGDTSVLERAGFIVDPGESQIAGNAQTVDEDVFADTIGQTALSLASAWIRRGLGLIRSWPRRMLDVLKGGPVAEAIVKDFLRDNEIWEEFKRSGGERRQPRPSRSGTHCSCGRTSSCDWRRPRARAGSPRRSSTCCGAGRRVSSAVRSARTSSARRKTMPPPRLVRSSASRRQRCPRSCRNTIIRPGTSMRMSTGPLTTRRSRRSSPPRLSAPRPTAGP